MEKRYPTYAKADITVESHDVAHEEVVGEIVDALAAKLGCAPQRKTSRKAAKLKR
jgi:hypothetical protein